MEYDVIVIGGGPAGLSAAKKLRKSGLRNVLVIERQDELGGIPLQCGHFGFGWLHMKRIYTGPGYARRLVRQTLATGVAAMTSTTVLEIDKEKFEVFCVNPGGHHRLRARAILIATGCRESTRSALKIPGYRGHGILNTSQAQQFLHAMDTLPGKRVVVFGSENVGLSAVLASSLHRKKVVAMIEERPHLVGYQSFALVTNHLRRVPLLKSHTIKRILGREKVEGVEVVGVDQAGEWKAGTEKTIACDVVVVSGRFVPENELLWKTGIPVDRNTKGPVVDQFLQTGVPGIFAAGNALRGVECGDVSALEGEWAAECIVKWLADRDVFKGERVELRPAGAVRWIMPQRHVQSAAGTPETPWYIPTMRVKDRVGMSKVKCTGRHGKWQSRTYLCFAPERRVPHPTRKWKPVAGEKSIEVTVE
ncbi:MAG: hypothetical protein A2583_15320 [Bdellovibrionales bacterium RIFOXYD1_FULL_53_11]|nr:MAG: hypothetical protein A2583_15320 [Bdellovibrionales bacterium RIFOXYD1_FULL_53_11]